MACSVFTLTAIAWERFFAIVYPLRMTTRIRNSRVTIVIAWFLSALVTSPSLYTMRVIKMDGVPYCHEIWSPPLHPTVSPLVFTIVSFVALYALPLTIIIALYSTIVYKMWFRKIPGNSHSSIRELEQRVKRNVVKMLITVVGVFTVSWLPLH
ncbi:predicted protein, partial [Nematostella vectensis]